MRRDACAQLIGQLPARVGPLMDGAMIIHKPASGFPGFIEKRGVFHHWFMLENPQPPGAAPRAGRGLE
jgi:hypothetical protein